MIKFEKTGHDRYHSECKKYRITKDVESWWVIFDNWPKRECVTLKQALQTVGGKIISTEKTT